MTRRTSVQVAADLQEKAAAAQKKADEARLKAARKINPEIGDIENALEYVETFGMEAEAGHIVTVLRAKIEEFVDMACPAKVAEATK